ncbi:MAG: hypothetical protein HN336_05155 [Lentimicrobiaceae bacterium]|jgi:hypothetical protein|nr:hypothetical protein [Lentimicrobiaceae bacterium]MCP4909132.1 hypothetical protein [Bacteroidota bacterium]MBT3453986.1 hypothetical protein [Lentimicrobiaceae bacterium]MBT3819104.1 hypothetical protein [Lentimicrobiaceae bacterium]MBT4060532.1 hypothetical protein [Lentimicrobiaceae bacterium]
MNTPNKLVEEIQQNRKLKSGLLKIFRDNSVRIKSLKRKWTDGDDVAAKLDMVDYLRDKGFEVNDDELKQVWDYMWLHNRHKAISDGDYDEATGQLDY